MSGICRIKNKERGLWFEIECLKENIELKKTLGKDTSFEEDLLKHWQKYTEADYAQRQVDTRKECHKSGGIEQNA